MATQQPGWLTNLIPSINTVQNAGATLPQRPTQNFTGSGVSTTDDPVNNRTNIAITGGGVAPSQGTVALVNGLNSNVSVPGAQSSIRFGSYTGAVILGGFAPATPPMPGQIYTLVFTIGQKVTIRNQDALSSSTNRIATGTGLDVSLPLGQEPRCNIQWDATASTYVLLDSGVHQDTEYDVLNFGLDPTGASDNTSAFNAMLGIIAANGTGVSGVGGGRIRVPTGSYRFNGTIGPLPQNTVLEGEGANSLFLAYGPGVFFRVANDNLVNAGGNSEIAKMGFSGALDTTESAYQAPAGTLGGSNTVVAGPWISAVIETGTSPAITPSGSPTDTGKVVITVTTAGTVAGGSARFSYKIGDASTVTNVTVASSVALGATGITIGWSAGTCNLGDSYYFYVATLSATLNGLVQCRYVDHGLGNGSGVTIASCSNTGANGQWYVRVISPDDFVLMGSTGSSTSAPGSGTLAFQNINEVGIEILGSGGIHIHNCVFGGFKFDLSIDGAENLYVDHCAFGIAGGGGYASGTTGPGTVYQYGFCFRAGTFRFDPVNGPLSNTSNVDVSHCFFNDHYYAWQQFDVYQLQVRNCRVSGFAWCYVNSGVNCIVEFCESDAAYVTVNFADFAGVPGGFSCFTFNDNFWSLDAGVGGTTSWLNSATGDGTGLTFTNNQWDALVSYPYVIPDGSNILLPITCYGNLDSQNSPLLNVYTSAGSSNQMGLKINHNNANKAVGLDIALPSFGSPAIVVTNTNGNAYITENVVEFGAVNSVRNSWSAGGFAASQESVIVDNTAFGPGSSTANIAPFNPQNSETYAFGSLTAIVDGVSDTASDTGHWRITQKYNVINTAVSFVGAPEIEIYDVALGAFTDPKFVISGGIIYVQVAAYASDITYWAVQVFTSMGAY